MKKAAIKLMIITIFSKVIGFFRDITLSYFYGASNISDAYLMSMTIPVVLFSFIGAGVNAGFIPMYSKIEKNQGIEEANRFTSNIINALLIVCTILVVLVMIFTANIVKAFASGFEGETLRLAIMFTRIAVFSIYSIALDYVFIGLLQIKGSFIIPALIGFPMNIITVFSIILSYYTNSFVLIIGSTIGLISEMIFLLPSIKKNSYKHRWQLKLQDKNLRVMMYTALPVIIGVSTNEINILVDRTIASQVIVGGISALNYASKINDAIQGIVVLSIVTVLFPKITKMAIDKNYTILKKTVCSAIVGISLLTLPATIGSMIFSNQVIKLLFGRGAFDIQAINLTSTALFFYSIGMNGIGLRQVLSKTFYSLQDTKTPMVNSTIGIAVNIILNIILSRFMGIGGLALATSISAIFISAMMIITLRKKIGPFGMKRTFISLFKILFASLVMGILAKFSFNYLIHMLRDDISLAIAFVIGAISYFGIIYFMKIDDVDIIIASIKKKFGLSV